MSAARAALYLRLSKEDGDRDGASQSIRNQRDFLLDYCGKNSLPVVEIYADDGYTGTNFNRPGFLRMVEDIEAGRVDTVLTKDLSRLGRDYILTGYYLERYFPERGVRYIAVNDRIDTAAEQSDMTPFRAVFNDLYAKDISRKVRAALQTRRQMGKFIGTYPPYGYRKDPADRNHLVVEAEEAAQVRRIYAWFLGGQTVSAIARRLTEEGVPTPSAGKRMACGQKPGAGWSYPMVRRILSMPTYRGDLVSRMSQKISYKLDRVRRLPREEWLVAEGTHEAIVSSATFERAQELLAVRGYAARRKPAEPRPLTGLFFCADCGAPMTLWSNGKARYFVCAGWKRNPGEHRCTAHYLREEAVLEAVRASLAELLAQVRDPGGLAEEAAGPAGEEAEILARRLERSRDALAALYRDRAEGRVGQEAFDALAGRMRRQERALADKLAAARRGDEAREDFRTRAMELLGGKTLSRGLALGLIERIEASSDKALVIRLRCADITQKR